MNKRGLIIIGVWLICFPGFFSACQKYDTPLYKEIEKMVGSEVEGKLDQKRVDEIKKGIAEYQQEVNRTVKASKQIGIYYQMLAVKYMEAKMFKLGLDSTRKALEYYPANPMLFYLAGMAAANYGKSFVDPQETKKQMEQAEKYYLKAIELKANFTPALYGLSILYVFELNKPLAAEEYLNRILLREKNNINAMFLLARVLVVKGETDRAIDLYTSIIDHSKDNEIRAKARELRTQVLEGGYGQ